MLPDHEAKKELEEISPFLSGLPRKMPYTVPEGYFESLPAQALAEAKRAKVVPMPERRPLFRQLAVAAITAGVLITGAWFYLHRSAPPSPALAQVSEAAVEKAIGQVSDTEMASFVEGNTITPSDDAIPDLQVDDNDVSLVLADVSDQELQQYLDQGNLLPNLN